ncbi:hypothetical protein ACFFRE_12390 [Aciditerrimonas ferrireducens]|uniref:Nucleoside phosphorylase domain-containing protein n=1 Tax=Aciditerrimonas ferrireducens TaxID=667306 RepID=A0ABV6C5F6_9ACTN
MTPDPTRRALRSGPLLVAALGLEAMVARADRRLGMGPGRAAAAAAAHLVPVARAGRPVVLVGLVGGLDPAAAPAGTPVVARAVGRPGGAALPLAADLAEQLAGGLADVLVGAGRPVCSGSLLGVDRVVRGAARAALSDRGALAFDMEALAVAEVLAAAGLLDRFGAVRVVAEDGRRGFLRGGLIGLRVLRRLGPAVRAVVR